MKFKAIFLAAGIAVAASGVSAQEVKPAPSTKPATVPEVKVEAKVDTKVEAKAEIELPRPNPAITDATTPMDLARAALAAHGGDKFLQLKSLFLRGTADLSSQQMPQVLPAKFAMTYKGDKTRMDIQSPMANISAITDGSRSYTNFKGLNLPSLNKFGTRVLTKIDQPGYVVSELPNRKKLRAFRITDPDGDATDFYVDPVSGRVMSYEFNYMNARSIIEHEKFKVVDGVLIPEKFAQRFEISGMGSFFAEFTVKEVQVNLEMADDVFAIPEQ